MGVRKMNDEKGRKPSVNVSRKSGDLKRSGNENFNWRKRPTASCPTSLQAAAGVVGCSVTIPHRRKRVVAFSMTRKVLRELNHSPLTFTYLMSAAYIQQYPMYIRK